MAEVEEDSCSLLTVGCWPRLWDYVDHRDAGYFEFLLGLYCVSGVVFTVCFFRPAPFKSSTCADSTDTHAHVKFSIRTHERSVCLQ